MDGGEREGKRGGFGGRNCGWGTNCQHTHTHTHKLPLSPFSLPPCPPFPPYLSLSLSVTLTRTLTLTLSPLPSPSFSSSARPEHVARRAAVPKPRVAVVVLREIRIVLSQLFNQCLRAQDIVLPHARVDASEEPQVRRKEREREREKETPKTAIPKRQKMF